ncbi:MAG TPA: hypothetical protein V6D30_21150 [Leptolyngbyaceae cyanobacterium]
MFNASARTLKYCLTDNLKHLTVNRFCLRQAILMKTLRDRNSRYTSIARANASYPIGDSVTRSDSEVRASALLLTADRTKTLCKVVIERTPGRYPQTHDIELPS